MIDSTGLRLACATAALGLAAAMTTMPALAQTDGGTLTIAIEGDLTGFDPLEARVFGQAGSTVASTILEPLVRWNYDTDQPEPQLATEWTESDDHLTWTFKLREGVKFHDGSDFTAEDVVHHYARLLDPENKYRGRDKMSSITDVRAVDDHTVEFTLDRPWAAMLPLMSDSGINGPIPSSDAIEAGTHNRHPIGTGPFKFVDWQSGDRITVERFDDYWDAGNIHLDRVEYKVLPDTQTRFASLKSGETDVIWTDRGPTIVEAQNDPSIQTMFSDGAGASTILINQREAPLDDINVRSAIAHAWNQAALVKISYSDTRPVVEHMLGRDCGDVGYKAFDMEKAKELIAAHGEPVQVELMHTTTPQGREMGELMQQLLAGAGIELTLKPVDRTTLIRNVFKREFQLAGWRMGGDPDMGALLLSATNSDSEYNLTGYDNADLDALGKEMRVAPTREERVEMQCEMAKLINEEVGQLYMGGGRYWAFANQNVKNLGKPYNGVIDPSRAWLEQQ